MKTHEEINGMTPEQIKEHLRAFIKNWHTPSFEVWKNGHHALVAVLSYIDQLEEQIQLMKIQMEGDCGVCKHRRHALVTQDGPQFDGPCAACIRKESRPAWEYEGLPELPKKGETA